MNTRPLVCAAKRLMTPQTLGAQSVRMMGGHGHGHYGDSPKPAVYNDLPLPEGPWQEAYNKKQSKYNRHLILGIAFFVGSMVAINTSGIMTYNATIPPLPKDENNN